MTPREAILDRIKRGPATVADLACEVHVRCSTGTGDMYQVAYSAIHELVTSRHIVRHDGGTFMLPPGVQQVEQ